MALLDPRFIEGGEGPGEAAHWTLVTLVTGDRIAGFGPEPHRAWEDFERWSKVALSFESGDLALAFFDPFSEGHEDFEEAWDNDLYSTELPTGRIAAGVFGADEREAFEKGWSNDGFDTSWDAVSPVTGSFDGEPHEDFEEGWPGNQSFAWTWAAVTSATATFDGQGREAFETGWTAATSL